MLRLGRRFWGRAPQRFRGMGWGRPWWAQQAVSEPGEGEEEELQQGRGFRGAGARRFRGMGWGAPWWGYGFHGMGQNLPRWWRQPGFSELDEDPSEEDESAPSSEEERRPTAQGRGSTRGGRRGKRS
jgi:hypothetical protein